MSTGVTDMAKLHCDGHQRMGKSSRSRCDSLCSSSRWMTSMTLVASACDTIHNASCPFVGAVFSTAYLLVAHSATERNQPPCAWFAGCRTCSACRSSISASQGCDCQCNAPRHHKHLVRHCNKSTSAKRISQQMLSCARTCGISAADGVWVPR